MKKIALFVFVVVVTSPCPGQWLERQVVIGDTLGGISLVAGGGLVVNPISGNVYIESDPVQVFNPVTREKLRGPGASGRVVFCPGSGKGYVLGDTAVILDAAADTAIGTTVLPFAPDFHAYSPTSNRLYLGEQNEDTLLVFDPGGDTILTAIEIGSRVSSLFWDSLRNRVYIGADLLKVLDCAADTFVGEVDLGPGGMQSLSVSYTLRKLYCSASDTGGRTVFVVSTESLKPIGIVPGLNEPSPDRFVFSPVTDRLYWSTGIFSDSVSVVDCQADTIRARFPASTPILAASTINGRVYVGLTGSSQVLVVDTSDSVVDTVAVPTVPTMSTYALAFGRDRNEVYGVTSGDLAFTIDASADTFAGAVNYAAYLPRQMIHNPAGNKLYLLCPGFDDILVLDSTFATPKHIYRGALGTYAFAVLNPALNQLYVADADSVRVIDCNRDSLVRTALTYDFDRPRPVLVPYLNKLYLFDSNGNGDYVYAYDALRDTVLTVTSLTDDVPSAVYDPRSNRVVFACEDTPSVRMIDPVRDSVVRTLDLAGGSTRGRFAVNVDLGRLYYTDQSPNRMFTIDLLADSIIGSESLPWDIDTLFLNRRLGKLYMCARDSARILVYDCAQGAIVDTIHADYQYAGLMDDRNDKLYLRHGAVVDCRYDSVVTRLDSINPRSMAWDAIDNRVFQATTSRLYVYRDDPYAVEEQKVGPSGPKLAVRGNPVRGAIRLGLQIPRGQTGTLTVYDAAGRRVHSSAELRTSSLDIDVRSLAAGIYFVRLRTDASEATAKVILQR